MKGRCFKASAFFNLTTMQKGERVGAIQSFQDGHLQIFGYGVFEGEVIPEEGLDGMLGYLHEVGVRNPCILLDSGERIYGAECWWGPEEDIKQYEARAKTKELVTVANHRKQYTT